MSLLEKSSLQSFDEYYSMEQCPFCFGELIHDYGFEYYSNCESDYRIVKYSGGEISVSFYISDYKFIVKSNLIIIRKIASSKQHLYQLEGKYIVTKSNYLKLIERAKNLAAFR